MGPIEAWKAAKELVEKYEKANNYNTAKLLAAFEETKDEWLVELKNALRLLQEQMRVASKERQQILDLALRNESFARVQLNFSFEAAREAIDERRRMLAYAAAGAADVTVHGPSTV